MLCCYSCIEYSYYMRCFRALWAGFKTLIKIRSCDIYSGGSPCGENNTYQIYPDNNDDGMIFSSAEINWWVLRILPPPRYIVCVEHKSDIFTFYLLCTFVSSGCQSRFRKFNSTHVLVRCTLFCKLLVFIVRANLPECWTLLKLKRLIRLLKLKPFCNVFDYLIGKRKASKGKFNHLAIDLMLWVIGTTECGNVDSFDLYRQVLLWVHRPEPIWIIEVILAIFTFSKALLFIFISKVSWFCLVLIICYCLLFLFDCVSNRPWYTVTCILWTNFYSCTRNFCEVRKSLVITNIFCRFLIWV